MSMADVRDERRSMPPRGFIFKSKAKRYVLRSASVATDCRQEIIHGQTF